MNTFESIEADDVVLLERAAQAYQTLRDAIAVRVVGQHDVVEALLVALLARGHVLLVGVPGLAKTLLVSTLAQTMELSFGRIQFTPDLLPADITGTDILEEDPERGTRRLRFSPGPIFANLILADEINRTPPKTQAALLQAMQERHVTSGTTTHRLPDPFQVFATQNPIEQEGTYLLPEAQLDRFLLEVHIDYPSAKEEREIARRTTSGRVDPVPCALRAQELRDLQKLVPRIPITDQALDFAVRATRATRPEDSSTSDWVKRYIRFGAGPRGSQALVLAAKARAALQGEAVVEVNDIRAVLVPVLRHRLVLSYRAEAERIRDVDIINHVMAELRE